MDGMERGKDGEELPAKRPEIPAPTMSTSRFTTLAGSGVIPFLKISLNLRVY